METAQGAWNVVRYNAQAFIKMGMVVLGLMLLTQLFSSIGEVSLHSGSMGMAGFMGILNFIILIATIAFYIPYAVNVNLFALAVGSGQAPDAAPLIRWRRNEWMYLLWSVILGVAFGVVFFIVSLVVGMAFGFGMAAAGAGGVGAIIAMILIFLLLIPLFYLASRFSFLFVETARSGNADPGASWRQTAPSHINIFLTYVMIALPFIGVFIVLGLLKALMPFAIITIVVSLIAAVVNFFFATAMLAGMALCFQKEAGA